MLTQTQNASIPVEASRHIVRGMLLTVLAVTLSATQVEAAPPYPVESFASIDDLSQEVKIQVTRLEKSLSTTEEFEKQKEKSVIQAFGLLACLGQALAEHAETGKSPWNGPALRDAALKFTDESDYDAAKAALAETKQVLEGKVTGEHAKLHLWNELIGMYPAMEEINTRNSEILKVLRRPRGQAEEISPVVAWGVLSLALKADSEYTSDDDEQKQWNGWSDEFHQATVKLGQAIRAKDKDAGRKAFDKASGTCKDCHKVFAE